MLSAKISLANQTNRDCGFWPFFKQSLATYVQGKTFIEETSE